MSVSCLYFIGAGASCEVLPLAKDFSSRLVGFAADLYSAGPKSFYDDPQDNTGDTIWDEYKAQFLENVRWLADETSHHASVDTFAKKLYFRNNLSELKRLKATLSAYLVAEQARNYIDKRYDSFLASVLSLGSDRKVRLPDSLRILTWNYDTQLEKAFYGFCEDKDQVLREITFNDKIYRVNGYCGTNPPGHIGEAFRTVWSKDSEAVWKSAIQLHREYLADPHSTKADIRFAWESPTQTILKNTLRLGAVSVAVIIGYSFPYFNREIDRLIFSGLNKLETIYLQFPAGVHEAIEERLRTVLQTDAKIGKVVGTDLFYLPDEFSPSQ